MPQVDPGGVGARAFRDALRTNRATEKAIRDALRSAERDAGRLLRTLPDETYSDAVRRQQYGAMQDELGRINRLTWQEIQDETNLGIRAAEQDAKNGAINLVDELTDTGVPDYLHRGMVQAAEDSVDRITASLSNRYELSQRVYKNAALSAGKVDAAVNNGIVLGKSAKEIAADVMRFISPNVPGGQSYAAMRLARTEIQNAFHEMSRTTYMRQPWVLGVKWNLSGSHPRNDICNDYAEQDSFDMGAGVFPKSDFPLLPHPHCLCSVTAVTPDQSDFIDNLLGGNYDQWLRSEGLAPLG